MTHKKQQAFVFSYGSAAAQEAQQEKHAPHGQDDVDAREEKGVGCHYLPKTSGVHHDPNPNTKEEGATQLRRWRTFQIILCLCYFHFFT